LRERARVRGSIEINGFFISPHPNPLPGGEGVYGVAGMTTGFTCYDGGSAIMAVIEPLTK